MAKASYRAAIIGCGRIASTFARDKKRKGIVTHAQAYLANPRMDLVAASDVDEERLREFGSDWRVKNLYTDYREMLRKEKIDIVSVSVPTSLHYQICRDAVRAGVRAIFCEKPMMASLREADKFKKEVPLDQIVFAVNHSRRWDAFEQKIAAVIRSGEIGTIQTLDAYYTAGIANSGSHLLDLIFMLTGETAVSVQAFPPRVPAKDPTVDVVLGMKSGFRCYLHALQVQNYLMFEVDIYGTLGRIRITNSGFSVESWAAKPHRVFSGYRELVRIKSSFGEAYRNVLPNAVADLVKALDKKQKVQSGFREGAQTLEVISAVHASLKNKNSEIRLPLKIRSIDIG